MDIILTISNALMAIGALLIPWQIKQAKRQAMTSFEDSLDKEYRDLVRQIPTEALLGKELDEREAKKHLDEFYAYIDLSNQQVFLRQRKRIDASTWKYWCDGIQSNLKRPAFSGAWKTIQAESANDFQELRRLGSTDFKEDPADWSLT